MLQVTVLTTNYKKFSVDLVLPQSALHISLRTNTYAKKIPGKVQINSHLSSAFCCTFATSEVLNLSKARAAITLLINLQVTILQMREN
jgi:hypothetical protein